jgi:hypothetical protein
MKAVVLPAVGAPLVLEDIPVPTPRARCGSASGRAGSATPTSTS